MTWRQFLIDSLMLMLCQSMAGQEGGEGHSVMPADSTVIQCESKAERNIIHYERRVDRMKRGWSNIVPNLSTLQYAGDIGMVSLGVGWDYGRRNEWETYLMFGYVPKNETPKAFVTMTLKEVYTPWTIRKGKHWGFSPLFLTLMVNTTLNGEFWTSEPDRYPKGYYGFSNKVRFHIGVGQKLRLFDIQKKSRWCKDMALYYEISTCDLYVRQKFLNKYIPLKDIFVLGVGIQYTIF